MSKQKANKMLNASNILDKQIYNFAEPSIILRKKYVFDKRLSASALNVLVKLKALPLNWELKISRSAKFMNVSENTLRTALAELEKNHYLQRERVNNNSYRFILVDPLELEGNDFDPWHILDYTMRQINFYKNSSKTTEEHLAFINGYFKLLHSKKDISENDVMGLVKKYCPKEY